MKLKKTNAVLGLLSVLTLLLHIGYCTFAYLTMYYNPTLKMLTAMPFFAIVCVHAVCGMCAVFLQSDGTRLDMYPKQNMQTIIQRISAALIFPLLIIHMDTFDHLKNTSGSESWFLFGLVIFVQIVFYGVVAAHVATSFSKGLITLGILQKSERRKTLDRIVYVLCGVAFLIAAIVVVRGQLNMFVFNN